MTSWTPNRSPVAAPHVHGRSNIPQVMRTVLLALLPATATGVFLFGWPALATVLLAVAVVAPRLAQAFPPAPELVRAQASSFAADMFFIDTRPA